MIPTISEGQEGCDFFDKLADETVLAVFSTLSMADLGNVICVSRRFRQISSDKELVSPLWDCAQKVIAYVYYPKLYLEGNKFFSGFTEDFQSNPWKTFRILGEDYCKKVPSNINLGSLACFGMFLTNMEPGVVELLQVRRVLKERWHEWFKEKTMIVIDPSWKFSLTSFRALWDALGELDCIEELILPRFITSILLELFSRFKEGELKVKKIVLDARFLPQHVRALFESMEQLNYLTTLHVNYSDCKDSDIEAISELICSNTSIKTVLIRELSDVSEGVLNDFEDAIARSSVTKFKHSWP